MIEKALAAAMEPIVDDLVKVERKMSTIELAIEEFKLHDPEPVEIDVDMVAKTVVDSDSFVTISADRINALLELDQAKQLDEVRRILYPE